MKKFLLSVLLISYFFMLVIIFIIGDLPYWELKIPASFDKLERKLIIIFIVMIILNIVILASLRKILKIIKEIKNKLNVVSYKDNSTGVLSYWKIDYKSMDFRENRKNKFNIAFFVILFCIYVFQFFNGNLSHRDMKIQGSFMQLDDKVSGIYIIMILFSILIFHLLYEIYEIIKEIKSNI